MRARWIFFLVAVVLLAGCGPEPLPQEKPDPPVEEPETPDNPPNPPDPPEEPQEPEPDPEPDPAALLAELREGGLLPPWQAGCLDIHSINGGRGESFYYIFPDGTTMLVDAAGGSDWEVVGEDGSGILSLPSTAYSSGNVIVRYIRNFAPAGSAGLDYAMVSHFHGDHMGNFTNSFTKFGWRPVNRNGEPVTSINLDKGDFFGVFPDSHSHGLASLDCSVKCFTKSRYIELGLEILTCTDINNLMCRTVIQCIYVN